MAMRVIIGSADPSVVGAGGVRAVIWGSFVSALEVHTCLIAAASNVPRLWIARWPSCVWQTSGHRSYSHWFGGYRFCTVNNYGHHGVAADCRQHNGGGSERGECCGASTQQTRVTGTGWAR